MADFLKIDGTSFLLLSGADRLILGDAPIPPASNGSGSGGNSRKQRRDAAIRRDDEEVMAFIERFLSTL
jgi:hypothetical protein